MRGLAGALFEHCVGFERPRECAADLRVADVDKCRRSQMRPCKVFWDRACAGHAREVARSQRRAAPQQGAVMQACHAAPRRSAFPPKWRYVRGRSADNDSQTSAERSPCIFAARGAWGVARSQSARGRQCGHTSRRGGVPIAGRWMARRDSGLRMCTAPHLWTIPGRTRADHQHIGHPPKCTEIPSRCRWPSPCWLLLSIPSRRWP